MWDQIRSYREQHGPDALRNFKLNILGEVMQDFFVPGEPGLEAIGALVLCQTLHLCPIRQKLLLIQLQQLASRMMMHSNHIVEPSASTCDSGAFEYRQALHRLARVPNPTWGKVPTISELSHSPSCVCC
eukprot:GHUV01052872.1.p1 GENE.GHUV01052872.1~~GHUV01052872.1.p1  ORF type:complete len:129 (-),score=20.67 GHUV01052872.1:243-629(-)